MGARGPKPLPANVHRLRGQQAKARANALKAEQTVSAPVKVPACPRDLSKDAKAEWRRITHELRDLGLIAELDRSTIAAYCASWAQWIEAQRKMAELGESGMVMTTDTGYQQVAIWLQISNKAQDQMRKYISEFGLSPLGRTKVSPNKAPEETADPSDQYFTR